MPENGPFAVEVIDEDVDTFHARSFDHAPRSLWIPRLSRVETLVLGSAQSYATVNEGALKDAQIPVVRRRSGGGAVLVSSEDLVWFDVVLPASDPLWSPDVGRSFDWLGRACQQALTSLGVDTDRHIGRLTPSRWSQLICFGGLGPGELTVGGKKLVGMSQRRSRSAARFQVAILRRWSGPRHASFLALADHERELASEHLARAAIGIDRDPSTIIAAIVEHLANAEPRADEDTDGSD